MEYELSPSERAFVETSQPILRDEDEIQSSMFPPPTSR
jgi:hypothetical protein